MVAVALVVVEQAGSQAAAAETSATFEVPVEVLMVAVEKVVELVGAEALMAAEAPLMATLEAVVNMATATEVAMPVACCRSVHRQGRWQWPGKRDTLAEAGWAMTLLSV